MSTSTSTTSGSLEARIAEIRAYDWSDEDKERAISLAILNHETWSSTTRDGQHKVTVLTGGDADGNPPRQPYEDDINSRIAWQDAQDPS